MSDKMSAAEIAAGLWVSEADRIAFEQDVMLCGTGYYVIGGGGRKARIAPEAVTIRNHLTKGARPMIDPKALEAAARALAVALFTNIEADVRSRDITDVEITALMDAALTAYHKHLAEAGLVIVPAEVVALLKRYRNETPAGHSPHMVCQEVDLVLAKV
jgi:hypothetical protein